MTTLSANYSGKSIPTTTSLSSKIGSFLRDVFVRFVQAHEGQAALLLADQHSNGAEQLHRLANKLESSQPNLATELRFIASRG